jgi:hypothetical protein
MSRKDFPAAMASPLGIVQVHVAGMERGMRAS